MVVLRSSEADSCPPHCCCCGVGEPCCDCGEVRPSATCEGERCFCGNPAAKKVGEEIAFDDPSSERHHLTAYVCAKHYSEIMGPTGARQVGLGSDEIDSGMSGDAVTRAEWVWVNLPTRHSWSSLNTHEKALVCHVIDLLRQGSWGEARA